MKEVVMRKAAKKMNKATVLWIGRLEVGVT